MSQKPVKVQSVMRALQLLEILMRSNSPLSAMELSQQTGLNRSTVHSLLDTLIACNYVQRDASYGKYFPTVKMYALSSVYADRLPFVHKCVPLVSKLALKYDLSLNLGILTQDDTLIVIKEFRPTWYRYHGSGYKLSFHATVAGKIHLAFLPEAKSEKLLAEQEMEPFTQYTIRDKPTLRGELEAIRRRGYALVRDEFVYGYASVGFPVFDADRNLVGSFSFSSTTDRMNELPPKFLDEGLQASRDCSLEMGCSTPPVFLPDEEPSQSQI